jgi:hypothetical protein
MRCYADLVCDHPARCEFLATSDALTLGGSAVAGRVSNAEPLAVTREATRRVISWGSRRQTRIPARDALSDPLVGTTLRGEQRTCDVTKVVRNDCSHGRRAAPESLRGWASSRLAGQVARKGTRRCWARLLLARPGATYRRRRDRSAAGRPSQPAQAGASLDIRRLACAAWR